MSVSDEAARAGEDVEESTAKDAVRIEHATPASTIKPPGAIMPKRRTFYPPKAQVAVGAT